MDKIITYPTLSKGNIFTNGRKKIQNMRGFIGRKIKPLEFMGSLEHEETIIKLVNICHLGLKVSKIRLIICLDNPPNPGLAPLLEKVLKISKNTLQNLEYYFEGNNELEQDATDFLLPLIKCNVLENVKLVGDSQLNVTVSTDGFASMGRAPRIQSCHVVYFYINGKIIGLQDARYSSIQSIYYNNNETPDYNEKDFDMAMISLCKREKPFKSIHFDLFSYAGSPTYISYLRMVESSKLLEFEISSKVITAPALPVGRICEALSKNKTLEKVVFNNDGKLPFNEFEKPLFECLMSHLNLKTLELSNSNVKPLICPPKIRSFITSNCYIYGDLFIRPPRDLESLIIGNGLLNFNTYMRIVESEELNNIKYIKVKNNYILPLYENIVERTSRRMNGLPMLEESIFIGNECQNNPRIDISGIHMSITNSACLKHMNSYFPVININQGLNLLFNTKTPIKFANEELINRQEDQRFFFCFKIVNRKLIQLSIEMCFLTHMVNPYLLLKYSTLEGFKIFSAKEMLLLRYYGYFDNLVFIQLLCQGMKENVTLRKLVFRWPIKDNYLIKLLLTAILEINRLKRFELQTYSDLENFTTLLDFLVVAGNRMHKVKLVLIEGEFYTEERKEITEMMITKMLNIRCETYLYFPNCEKFNQKYRIEYLNPAIKFLQTDLKSILFDKILIS